MRVSFTYRGLVRGQGRPRFTKQGRAYEARADKLYKRDVALEYARQCGGTHFGGEPLRVVIDVMRCLPQTLLMRGIAQAYDTIKPDCDNLAKAVLDALNGIAYDDDKQIIELVVRKFPRVALPDGLDVLRVTISSIDVTDYIYPYQYEERGNHGALQAR